MLFSTPSFAPSFKSGEIFVSPHLLLSFNPAHLPPLTSSLPSSLPSALEESRLFFYQYIYAHSNPYRLIVHICIKNIRVYYRFFNAVFTAGTSRSLPRLSFSEARVRPTLEFCSDQPLTRVQCLSAVGASCLQECLRISFPDEAVSIELLQHLFLLFSMKLLTGTDRFICLSFFRLTLASL